LRLNAPLSRLDLLIYGHYRIVHGLRIALAFMLTFLLTRELKLPESTWPLITLVVVMGPISFWGNVLSRALQRVVGTIFGASCGVVALSLELYSLPLMLLWCGCIMFLCGYLALGKRPYVGLLIGITLGAPCWRCCFAASIPSAPTATGGCRCTTPCSRPSGSITPTSPPTCWSGRASPIATPDCSPRW